jgi:hypothetical protein
LEKIKIANKIKITGKFSTSAKGIKMMRKIIIHPSKTNPPILKSSQVNSMVDLGLDHEVQSSDAAIKDARPPKASIAQKMS